MDAALLVLGGSGLAAMACSAAVIAPTSRELIHVLHSLADAAKQAAPELYRERIEAHDPFRTGKFVHKHVTGMLKADFGAFGPECQRLHARARQLDRRAHYGLIPLGLFALGCAAWWVQR